MTLSNSGSKQQTREDLSYIGRSINGIRSLPQDIIPNAGMPNGVGSMLLPIYTQTPSLTYNPAHDAAFTARQVQYAQVPSSLTDDLTLSQLAPGGSHSGIQPSAVDPARIQNALNLYGSILNCKPDESTSGFSALHSVHGTELHDTSPGSYSPSRDGDSDTATPSSPRRKGNGSGAGSRKIAHSRKILVRVRLMWLSFMPEGRQRDLACFILDKHGNQMPYDRQYWSYAYKSNRLTDRDEQTKSNLDKGVDTLKRFVVQVERAGEIVRAFMSNHERSKQIPGDLTDDYLKQWLSGPNAVLIRKLINNDPEVRDVHLPTCLNADNIARALNHGGLLIKLPPHSQRSYEYFNLLSPGRGDTRHTELAIPDGGNDIDVKKSRTQLAFPNGYFPDSLLLPKVCVFQIDSKLELLLFYRGNNQKRPRRALTAGMYSDYQSSTSHGAQFMSYQSEEDLIVAAQQQKYFDDPYNFSSADAQNKQIASDPSNLSSASMVPSQSSVSPNSVVLSEQSHTPEALSPSQKAANWSHDASSNFSVTEDTLATLSNACQNINTDDPKRITPMRALQIAAEHHHALQEVGEEVLLVQTNDNSLFLIRTRQLSTHGGVSMVTDAQRIPVGTEKPRNSYPSQTSHRGSYNDSRDGILHNPQLNNYLMLDASCRSMF